MSLRPFLAVLALPVLLQCQTGVAVPSLSGLDDVMLTALQRHSVRGGALAIVKDGRLIFARGYGMADVEANQPVEPTSLFRYCSVSKTLVASAVMRLVDEGKISLDDVVWDRAPRLRPYNGKWGESAVQRITIRQLLTHSGGWDRDISGDPMNQDWCRKASQESHQPYPPTDIVLARYMLTQRLDFAPGTRFAYSNLGFMLLSLLVEDVTGRRYYDYLKDTILDPMNIGGIKQGATAMEDRLPGEVRYYDYPGAPLMQSAYTRDKRNVAQPYGAAILRPGTGAMVGSVIHLAKLAATIDGQRPWMQLKQESFDAMISEQPTHLWSGDHVWYGMGFEVHGNDPSGFHWGHGGAFPGSRTLYFRCRNGISVAFLFNGDTKTWEIASNTASAILVYLQNVSEWPEHDLFPNYFPARPADSGPGARSGIYSLYGVDLAGPDLRMSLRDSAGSIHEVPILYAGPGQINCVLPDEAAEGNATLVVSRAGQSEASSPVNLRRIAPLIYAARTERAKDGTRYLAIYASGVRHRASLDQVRVMLGGAEYGALYAGPQMQFAGLDQINIDIGELAPGQAELQLIVEGSASAAVKIDID